MDFDEAPFQQYELILASQSPRRRQLLGQLGFPISFADIHADEHISPAVPAASVAESLALKKADAFPIAQLQQHQILVTADTIVVLDHKVLGKPKDRTEAFDMLSHLSGGCNHVYTGVCLKSTSATCSFTERSDVFFRHLEDWEINYYLDHCHYQDKAGSYGIQEWIGMVGVQHIEGCYYNVMGLPLARLYNELLQLIRKS